MKLFKKQQAPIISDSIHINYHSTGVIGFVVANEVRLELYCGGALGIRPPIPKSFGCAATKLYGGGVISFIDESFIIVS